MSWARVDDRLHDHPKTGDAGFMAMGLWVEALSFCQDQLTDGFVARRRVAGLAAAAGCQVEIGFELAAKLCEVGFWHHANEPCPLGHTHCDTYRRDEDGWRFHDWSDYQPSKDEVIAEKERKQRNLRNHREKKRRAAAARAGETGFTTGRATGPDAGGDAAGATVLQPGRNHGPIPIPIPIPDQRSLQAGAEDLAGDRAREPQAAAPASDDHLGRILAALRAQPKLASIATEELAETILGRAVVAAAKPVEWVERAIADAAAHSPDGLNAEALRRKTIGYCENVEPRKRLRAAHARPGPHQQQPRDGEPHWSDSLNLPEGFRS